MSNAWEKAIEERVTELEKKLSNLEGSYLVDLSRNVADNITDIAELKEDLFQFEERIYTCGIIPRPKASGGEKEPREDLGFYKEPFDKNYIIVKREDLQYLINWFDWEFANKKEQDKFTKIKEEYNL